MILHEEDEYRNSEDKEQRHLAEICGDLIADLRSFSVEFCPVTELCLAKIGECEADFCDDNKDKEALPVVFLEESDDLLFEVCENKAREECGS